jgi:hypothetical protein
VRQKNLEKDMEENNKKLRLDKLIKHNKTKKMIISSNKTQIRRKVYRLNEMPKNLKRLIK